MMQILIIRSVSFQQLDNCFPAILEAFPQCQIDLLTHEHGIKQALTFRPVRRVYNYPESKSFNVLCKTTGVDECNYDAVIIPVANISGAGFDNVLLFSLRVRAQKRYICSLTKHLAVITVSRILLQSLKNGLYRCVALLLSLLLVPVLIYVVGLAFAWNWLSTSKQDRRD